MMLGSTRPTVTLVAGTLQKAGLIKYTTVASPSWTGRAWKRRPASAMRR